MAYFSKGYTKDKLMILHFLRAFDEGITLETLCLIMDENDWVRYLDTKVCVRELEYAKMVAAVPCPAGVAYRITPAGEEAHEMFKERIRNSVREAVTKYIEDNRSELKKDAAYVAKWEKLDDGRYIMTMSVTENRIQLIRLELLLDNIHCVRAAEKNWKMLATNIYMEAMAFFMPEPYGEASESDMEYTFDKISQDDGSFLVKLAARMGEETVMGLELIAPSEEFADAAEKNWPSGALVFKDSAVKKLLS